ncbi:MAG TPA: CDGSH iron-sulfur domain-containing protein [Candidatus Lokiarchaeia archaeon]|nr:CDGSH iron-sulfur domain-containing protein [Candidatus Lokiarchaeia archaeon]
MGNGGDMGSSYFQLTCTSEGAQVNSTIDADDSAGVEPFKIIVKKNGPYFIAGKLPLRKEYIITDDEGMPVTWSLGDPYPDNASHALCRCGHSSKQPFCDSTHRKIGFDGTETARKENYHELSSTFTGPELLLTDARVFCASAHFCHRAGGTWVLAGRSSDPDAKATAIEQACNCPSGRLVAWNKESSEPIEPIFEPSVSVVEDPGKGVSGPLWVKGGVPVESSDGERYEIRNRITLCRCGRSSKKPFCNGAHLITGFDDGDEILHP